MLLILFYLLIIHWRLLGKYTTLSYCGGDPKETEIITVNGINFNAFANLGHALRQAGHFWRDKFDGQGLLLWADEICIKQSNLSERSHQVGFMAKIYENATQVLVSLSSEGDRTGGLGWISRTALRMSLSHLITAKMETLSIHQSSLRSIFGPVDGEQSH